MPLAWILVVAVTCGPGVGLAALAQLIFPPAAVLILGLALPFVLVMSLTIGAPSHLKGRIDSHHWSQLEEVVGLAAGILGSAFLFGALCRELFLAGACSFENANGARYSNCVGFGFDNQFEAVFFDIPALYGLHSSSIRPASFWSAGLVLLYRVIVDVLLIKVLIRQILHHERL